MHIVFAHIGNFVVHNVWQIVNVDAAGGNVGGHQRADVSTLEAAQRLGTGGLAFIAMQSQSLDAILRQELGDIIGAKFGAGKHQHLAPVVFLDDVGQQCFLLAATNRVNQLGDALHCGVARCHLDA